MSGSEMEEAPAELFRRNRPKCYDQEFGRFAFWHTPDAHCSRTKNHSLTD